MDARYAELDLTGCGLGQQEVNSFNHWSGSPCAYPIRDVRRRRRATPSMVRRGSTVRVRQECSKSRKTGLVAVPHAR